MSRLPPSAVGVMRASDDVEAQLVEDGGGARETVLAPRRVDEHDRRAAAARVLGDGDERARVAGLARGEHGRVPGDLRGGVPQEVGVGEASPRRARPRSAATPRRDELLARERLRLGDQLLLVERRLEAAAQRAACVRS